MARKQEGMLRAYERASFTTLSEAYTNCSAAKRYAFRAIEEEMHEYNGFGLRITGHSCFTFSCAYQYPDPETGELRLRYHTHANVYDFAFPTDE